MLPEGRVRSEPQYRARPSPPRSARERSLFVRQEPGGARHRRVFERPVCGQPGLLGGQQAQEKMRSRALRARLEELRWPAFAPRVHRALKLRVRVSRKISRSRSQRGVRNHGRTFPAGFLPIQSPAAAVVGAITPMQSVAPVSVGLRHDGRHRLAFERPLALAAAFNVLSVMPTRSKRVDGPRSLVRRSLS